MDRNALDNTNCSLTTSISTDPPPSNSTPRNTTHRNSAGRFESRKNRNTNGAINNTTTTTVSTTNTITTTTTTTTSNNNINNSSKASSYHNETDKDILTRIGRFLNDNSYKEFIESSSSFNQKLVQERRFRLPFLDSQTGVAQSDCSLWMSKNDRLPRRDTHTIDCGKIYTYPAKKWIKRKRQYLLDDIYLRTRASQQQIYNSCVGTTGCVNSDTSMLVDHSSNDTQPSTHYPNQPQPNLHHHHPMSHVISSSQVPTRSVSIGAQNHANSTNNGNSSSFYNNHNDGVHNHQNNSSFMHDSSSNSNAYSWNINEQSKDATTSSKVDPDESTSEATAYGDQEDSSDPHHTPNNLNHNQQQQPHLQQQNQNQINNRSANQTNSPVASTPKRKRDRKKVEKPPVDPSAEPFKCQYCEKSYKTRPGLTYHRTHCHPQHANNSSGDNATTNEDSSNSLVSNLTGNQSSNANHNQSKQAQSSSSSVTLPNHESGNTKSGRTDSSLGPGASKNGSSKSSTKNNNEIDNNNDNSPYCDFCLGDAKENKKTQKPEELVSCSDCGRSGHPTCLNFTANIIASVKKYKWQCIECKSCGLCGTSDNDDQLLFCDDCDRGYHMYCLDPPLSKPPEGSWSCVLCIEEYHTKDRPKEKGKEQGDIDKSTDKDVKEAVNIKSRIDEQFPPVPPR